MIVDTRHAKIDGIQDINQSISLYRYCMNTDTKTSRTLNRNLRTKTNKKYYSYLRFVYTALSGYTARVTSLSVVISHIGGSYIWFTYHSLKGLALFFGLRQQSFMNNAIIICARTGCVENSLFVRKKIIIQMPPILKMGYYIVTTSYMYMQNKMNRI